MGNRNLSLTQGKPLYKILIFSIPLVLGTFFQQFYSFVDSIIIGRCISNQALGGVGATYSLNFLIIGFIQGFCIGLSIPLSQSIGAKNKIDMQRFFWNGTWLCIIVSIVLGVMMTWSTPWLLALIKTPANLLNSAILFIRPQFSCLGVTILYNFSASVLRAMGDSRHPFYFLVLASFLNIALDFLFIITLHWGVTGAAWATILAQLFSGLLNIFWIKKKYNNIFLKTPKLKFSTVHVKRLLYISLPMGFEYSISALGAIVMQVAINHMGSAIVIAQTAGEKIRQTFTLPMESIGMGMTTYVGQNIGAKSLKRVQQGIKAGIQIQFVYCIFCLVIIMLFAPQLSEFMLGYHHDLIVLSSLYLRIMSMTFILHGSLMIYRNTLQGLGYSFQAILSGICELTGRSLTSFIAITMSSFTTICLINPAAWGLALAYCMFITIKKIKQLIKQKS